MTRKTSARPPRRTRPAPPSADASPLSPRERLFVEAFVGAAQFNATLAYKLAGYRTAGKRNQSANAARLMARDRVGQAVRDRLAQRVAQLSTVMDGDEALERLTLMGRADIGKVLGPRDRISNLPDDVRLTIKTVRPTRYGRVIELYDAQRAAELLAKAGGKLIERHEHRITLEEIIAGVEADAAPDSKAVH